MKGHKRLLAVLADAGVTEADYTKILKARQLVDEVNTALATRGSALMYAVTLLSSSPRSEFPPPEIRETT